MLKSRCGDWHRRLSWQLLVLMSAWWLAGCCSSSNLVKADANARLSTSGLGQITPAGRSAVAATVGSSAGGADQKQVAAASDRPCDPYSAPNTCYQTGSTCNLVVLTCQRCCYDENGNAKGPSSCICGACVGVSFP